MLLGGERLVLCGHAGNTGNDAIGGTECYAAQLPGRGIFPAREARRWPLLL